MGKCKRKQKASGSPAPRVSGPAIWPSCLPAFLNPALLAPLGDFLLFQVAWGAVNHDDLVSHPTPTLGQTHESGWYSQATTPGHCDSFREDTRPKQGQRASYWRPLDRCWETEFLSSWRLQNWEYLEPRWSSCLERVINRAESWEGGQGSDNMLWAPRSIKEVQPEEVEPDLEGRKTKGSVSSPKGTEALVSVFFVL